MQYFITLLRAISIYTLVVRTTQMKSMSLKESLKVAKENNTQIRYVIPLDKDDELELKVVCEELNQSKF